MKLTSKSSARARSDAGRRHITRNMYASLENLIRSSRARAGRKLAFFISDGFLMDVGPQAAEPARQARSGHRRRDPRRRGAVYTIDARGLNTSTVVDVANSRPRHGSADPGRRHGA